MGFQIRNFVGMVVGAHKGKLKRIDSTTNKIHPPTLTLNLKLGAVGGR